jgi:choice-of-anchor B domain-containing protein
MFRYFTILFCSILIISCEYESFESEKDLQTPLASCVDGVAKIPGTDLEFSCLNYDLVGYVSLEDMDAKSANDVWGWTDSFGKEYAIIGLDNGTAFIDISDPVKPIYLGKLPTQTVSTIWRDIKTNKNYAYIVADFNSLTPEQDRNHGLQVFDLTKLSSANESPLVFSNDYLYDDFGKAHNIAINEKTNFLYAVGTETFQGGIHIVDLVDPLVPVFSQGFSEQGYSHDAQVVTYEGPDTEHRGKEIFFGSNEDKIVLVDVSNKLNIDTLSTEKYSNTQYTHQGWLTEDQKYFIVGDELDEYKGDVSFTRSIIFDVSDLDDPKVHYEFLNSTDAIDHNGYTHKNKFYLASYTAGLRVLDILNIDTKSISEIGFFDTFNESVDSSFYNTNLNVKTNASACNSEDCDNPEKGEVAEFNGAWSTYPFFKSENILISDYNSGLFIVKKQK